MSTPAEIPGAIKTHSVVRPVNSTRTHASSPWRAPLASRCSITVDGLTQLCLPLFLQSWGTLAIGATPYGHCVDSTGAYITRPQSSSVAEARRSRIPMDHYDYAVGNAAASAEVKAVHGKGKGIPPGPGALHRHMGMKCMAAYAACMFTARLVCCWVPHGAAKSWSCYQHNC